jgi:hypothetical protein
MRENYFSGYLFVNVYSLVISRLDLQLLALLERREDALLVESSDQSLRISPAALREIKPTRPVL